MAAPDKKLRLMEEEMNRFEAEIAHQVAPPASVIPASSLTTNLVFPSTTAFIPHQLRTNQVSAPPPMPPGISAYAPLITQTIPAYPKPQPPAVSGIPSTQPQNNLTTPAVIVSKSSSSETAPKVITAPPQMAGPLELAARAKEAAKSKSVAATNDDDDDVTRALLTAAAGVTYKWVNEPGGKKKVLATITKPPLTLVVPASGAAVGVDSKKSAPTHDKIPPAPAAAAAPPLLPPPPPYRATAMQAAPTQPAKKKKYIRVAAGTTWVDPTLADWDPNDFRMFCGDLGNEVSDDTLARAFNRYPSFQKARVIRDKRTGKSRGYGFVSFSDPADFTKAMREMNGKYVGNRPIKLKRSDWRSRQLETHRKKEKEKKKLGLKN